MMPSVVRIINAEGDVKYADHVINGVVVTS